jgi:hypothetical protein
MAPKQLNFVNTGMSDEYKFDVVLSFPSMLWT